MIFYVAAMSITQMFRGQVLLIEYAGELLDIVDFRSISICLLLASCQWAR